MFIRPIKLCSSSPKELTLNTAIEEINEVIRLSAHAINGFKLLDIFDAHNNENVINIKDILL